MNYYAAQYTYVDDAPALDEVRPRHRAYLNELAAGPLVASGPCPGTRPPSALLLFNGETLEEISRLLDADPFWEAGLIAERTITQWDPVIGVFAD